MVVGAMLVYSAWTGLEAASVSLVWDPSPSAEAVGYKLYCSSAAGSKATDVGSATNAIVDNLVECETYQFYATAYDTDRNESGPSNELTYTVPPPGPISGGGSVTFVKADKATSGNWKGVYGVEGYLMAGLPSAAPPYASVTTSAPVWVWQATSINPRNLQDPRDSTNRFSACWYSSSAIAFDLSFTDGIAHRLAMYFIDASNSGRQERVEIFDGVNGATLYSRDLTNFSSGVYLITEIGGKVTIRITPMVGNAVVSGMFFDGLPAPGPTTSARFVKSDASTRGDWKGVYGNEGYAIAGASASPPAYASFATTAPQWTWQSPLASPSGLMQPGTSTSRIAACWYSATEVGLDLSVTDGQTHLVSVYFFDGSASGRQQQVDVLDRATGAVLDTRSLSNFASGIYMTWQIAGNVTIRLTPSNVNAVASGIFFDPPTN